MTTDSGFFTETLATLERVGDHLKNVCDVFEHNKLMTVERMGSIKPITA